MTVHGSWTGDRLVEAYTQHERRTRGLRPQTLRIRACFARMLVRAALGTDPIDPSLFSVNYFCRFATAILAGSTRRPGQRGPRCPPRVVVGRDAPSRLGRKAHNCNLSGGAGGVSPEGP